MTKSYNAFINLYLVKNRYESENYLILSFRAETVQSENMKY